MRALAGLHCLFCIFLLSGATALQAGELDKTAIEQRFKPPLRVGEKLREVPAWPLTSELTPAAGPVGYVFESIDLAPIPGFEGTPFNLLIAIEADGRFIDVEVLRQHEPVFLGGFGPGPLLDFVRQYAGKNLKQEIVVSSTYGDTRGSERRVVLDGIAKATASVRIVNQTVLAAALAVARKRLGFADNGGDTPPARVKTRPFVPLDIGQLRQRGYLQTLRLTNAEVEALFAGTDGAGSDDAALQNPAAPFLEMDIAWLNPPDIGRNLLGNAAWEKLQTDLGDGRPAFWIATRGRYPLTDEKFVPGTQPSRLTLSQGGLPLELRDANRDYARQPAIEFDTALILTTPAQAGLDPGRPLEFGITISRAKGMILPVVTQKTVNLVYRVPPELLEFPPQPPPEWLLAWQDRSRDLILIGLALVVLATVLVRPRWVSAAPRRLRAFRLGFLAFTLVFIGWHAQGQLSIVQLTGAIKAVVAGAGLGSFLYDPISLLLIAFTLVALPIWGHAAFCGWLCPFGALQEFVALMAKKLRLPQRRLSGRTARWLARSRYPVLALLIGTAAFAPTSAEKLVEIEPFKTVITVGFDRSWPYLLWALGLLAAGAFCYKFFCRFVCPLGAALTLGGRLRRRRPLQRNAANCSACQQCRSAGQPRQQA